MMEMVETDEGCERQEAMRRAVKRQIRWVGLVGGMWLIHNSSMALKHIISIPYTIMLSWCLQQKT